MEALYSVMRKKHSSEEIEAKLRQAERMEAQGKPQRDIAKALDISVMTFHRWRKRPPRATEQQTSFTSVTLVPDKKNQSELEIENSRLRRLVTDLLLEKLRLEDALSMATRRRAK